MGTVSGWRRVRLWAVAHAVDDFYQGLVPSAVPFFVLERHLDYVAAAGLATAATVGSAVPQLVVGVLADRFRLPWLAPTGVALAGVGAGLAGVLPSYGMVLVSLLASGVGVAMFHPPAGRDARRAGGGSTGAMSLFAAGGGIGFLLAPVVVTPALRVGGLGATVLLVPPALLTGALLWRRTRVETPAVAVRVSAGSDRWGMFALLTAVEVVRSTVSFGTSAFVSLYWIRHLGAGPVLGGAALTLVLAGSVLGTLAGGRLADRVGPVRTVRLGNALALPAMAALLLVEDRFAALPLALLVGVVTGVPFAVLVALGQDYLPRRPGTAAGVTLGLAVSAGGLAGPLLGAVAEARGPQGALTVLAVLPVVGTALALGLRDPTRPSDRPSSPGAR